MHSIEEIKSSLQFFKENKMELSMTIRRFGYPQKHNCVRVVSIKDDEKLDIVSRDSSHTMTIRDIPFGDVLEISATSSNPIDKEQLKEFSPEEVFSFLDEDFSSA